MKQEYHQSEEMRKAKTTHWEFNNIRMGYTLSTFDTSSRFSASNNKDSVRLHFGLKGDYSFSYKQLNRSFDLAGGHHNLMFSKGIDLEVQNKTLEIETFGIDFPKDIFIQFTKDGDDLLKEFTEAILCGKHTIFSKKWGTINVPIQKVIDEIMRNPYSGELQNIFLLSKSLELLVLCIDNYNKLSKTQPSYLKTKSDKEKVIAARDYINERLTSPPNLSEIALKVGLNEFKLKNGFKEMFHSTIFGYLTARRLNLAKQYLHDTQKTAAEIAFELGYSSPQHFNHQFRKNFGVTPNSIRNNP